MYEPHAHIYMYMSMCISYIYIFQSTKKVGLKLFTKDKCGHVYVLGPLGT